MPEKIKASRRGMLMKKAALIALAGNAFLSALKIGAGIYADSLAVLGDGIDSSVDVLIALMSLVVAGVISRPADAAHPWGHGRAETVGTAVLSYVLFFAGAQLILKSAAALFSGAGAEVPGIPALLATAVSMAGKIFLAWTQYRLGEKAGSAMLKANAKNMASDVVISLGVLAGLGLSICFKIGAIDQIAAILVGLWVIKSALGIFQEVNVELMDGAGGYEPYREVFAAVHTVPGAGNPHRTRMRRIAGYWDIDIDIEVNPGLSVREAHAIASKVETAIKDRIDGVYDIMVHVEPAGEAHKTEGFGLREGEPR
ncbi:MAG: cation diffusion facilitator family transporter [Treponema sp.]|jgi:cation diffusion facilitator family transporter|nr:cation diffusion facilitator family transporter [Treponema sp.]